MIIKTSGAFVIAVCQVQTDKCKAIEEAAPLTVVWGNGLQINVCSACLEEKMRIGEWEIPGASVANKVYKPDFLLENNSENLIIEVKGKLTDADRIANPIIKEWSPKYLLVATLDSMFIYEGGIDKKQIKETKEILGDYLSFYTTNQPQDLYEIHSAIEKSISAWLFNIKNHKLDKNHCGIPEVFDFISNSVL
ncbi:MAG: hypothetical protein LBV04_03275, partial [Deferribacteraceae bacterium]|nr:hypothetical protein [Deferribacteraceae bacterium]